jgi:hypothetical protein
LLVCLLTTPALAAETKKGGKRPNKAAANAIRAVAEAARKKDFVALRALMIDEFTWSFGGDSSADQAITAWQKHPEELAKMDKVLRLPCHTSEDVDHVDCPGKGAGSHRAAFIKTAAGWKMINFVAGD